MAKPAGFEPATFPVHRYAFRENLKLVEPAGLEPATSSMPSRRAPNCATAPQNANTANAVIAFIAPCECERQTTPVQLDASHVASFEHPHKSCRAMTRKITRREIRKVLATAGTGTLALGLYP